MDENESFDDLDQDAEESDTEKVDVEEISPSPFSSHIPIGLYVKPTQPSAVLAFIISGGYVDPRPRSKVGQVQQGHTAQLCLQINGIADSDEGYKVYCSDPSQTMTVKIKGKPILINGQTITVTVPAGSDTGCIEIDCSKTPLYSAVAYFKTEDGAIVYVADLEITP